MSGQIDERSAKNIATLLPLAQIAAREFLLRANAELFPLGVQAKIISGTRSYAEQAKLYAQGRTAPGRIVTNARPGYSNHNFGVAWDIGIFKGTRYLGESPLYRVAVAVGRECGLNCGADWRTFKDEPHFEYRTGLTTAQMRERVRLGQAIIA